MAGTITSTGLGSGLDIESLVTKLMSVEQQPILQIQTKEAKETAKLSALGQIKSALSSLQSAAQALDTRKEFAAYKASIADSSIATVAASSSAIVGSYSVEVTKLADVQKIRSSGFASLTSAVTADAAPVTLTLEIGKTAFDNDGNPTSFTADATKTKTITIDSTNNTLQGLKDAINNAKAGVTASIVNDGGATPYRLVLSSDKTGTESSFKLSGPTDFSYDPGTGTGTGFTNVRHAADAKVNIDGVTFTKQSNVITDAMDGVTLTLAKTNIGSPTTLTVASDSSAITSKVSSFVKAYNDVLNQIKSLTGYSSETKTGGTLTGDTTVRSIKTQLNGILTSTFGSGSLKRLSDIGIGFQKDGTLNFDTTKFQSALSDTTKDVPGLFVKDSSSTGAASKIDEAITSFLKTGGQLTAHTDGINAKITSMEKRITTLSDRLTTIEARYRAQFTRLDSTVSSLNSTSSYLTQQLTALSNLAGISSSSSK